MNWLRKLFEQRQKTQTQDAETLAGHPPPTRENRLPTSSSDPLLTEEVRELLQRDSVGGFVDAVKLWRERTQQGLKESKNAVEGIRDRIRRGADLRVEAPGPVRMNEADVPITREQTADVTRSIELRRVIWAQVEPLRIADTDIDLITSLGAEAVPIIISIFMNPTDPRTGIACNQAILTYALTVAARGGNEMAAEFLRKIAAGTVQLYDTWGQSAFNIAREYVSKVPDGQGSGSGVPGAKVLAHTFDDAILRAESDAAAAAFQSDRIRLQDLAVLLSEIKRSTRLVDTKDRNGWTALGLAARFGHSETVELLTSRGAAVNAEAYVGGVTALMSAVTNGHLNTVRVLLSRGADVNATDREGRTPWQRAVSCDWPEIAALLKAHGGED